MKNEGIILPDRMEMLQRLMRVDSSVHVLEGFYPELLRFAGQRRTLQDLVNLVFRAIEDFTKNVALIFKEYMYKQAPQFIEVLLDDSELIEQAKIYMQEALCVA